jgi:hypothetical protein
MRTSMSGADIATYTFDGNGNLIGINDPSGAGTVTMIYDDENRCIVHQLGLTITTYSYAANGLKRTSLTQASLTTFVWDGSQYLQARN